MWSKLMLLLKVIGFYIVGLVRKDMRERAKKHWDSRKESK